MSKQSFPKLQQYSMLLVNNNRSKSYLQNLIHAGFKPSHVLILDAGRQKLAEQTAVDLDSGASRKQSLIRECKEAALFFDENEHVVTTLKRHAIDHDVLVTADVNDKHVAQYISQCPGDYLVYSGPGGSILNDQILSAGKHVIHVHPGWLPTFRGSTTIYYSMLAGEEIGCTVLALTRDIDQGPVLYQRKFMVATTSDLDRVFDPVIRTATLLDFFSKNWNKRPTPLTKPAQKEGNDFYIIHPVLKHLAVRTKKSDLTRKESFVENI